MDKETMSQPTEGTNGTGSAGRWNENGHLEHERKPIERIYELSPDEWVGKFPDGQYFIHDGDPMSLMDEVVRHGLHMAR